MLGGGDFIFRRTNLWPVKMIVGIAQPPVPSPCLAPHFFVPAPRTHISPLTAPSDNCISFVKVPLHSAHPHLC